MIIENLSQLYPKGYLSKTIGSEATYSIPVDDQFFIVNKAFLSIKNSICWKRFSQFLKTQQLLVTILGSVTYFNRQITCRRDLSYVANSNECHKRITS